MRLYVGTEGNYDGETFATPEEAVARMRSLRAGGETEKVEIYLEGGTYYCPGTLKFTDIDTNFSIQPYNGQDVTITSCPDVPFSEFTLAEDSRIPASAQGNVYKANLSRLGIASYPQMPITGHSRSQLEVDGYTNIGSEFMPIVAQDSELLQIARYPNTGYMTTQSVVTNGTSENGKNFAFKSDAGASKLSQWANENDMQVHGFWYYDWSDMALGASVDAASGTITSKLPSPYGVRSGQRYYVYNMLCELDSPGEWYYDTQTGDLYIWPKSTSRDSKINIDFNAGRILTFSGSHDATVSGLNLTNSMNYLLRIEGDSRNITVTDCVLKNSGFGAASVSGSNITVSGCEIANCMKGAISVSGGNQTTLVPGNNAVIGCEIHDYALLMKTYAAGASLGGVGNKVIGCEIYNSPQNAITGGGNDHLVQGNKIHDVLKEAADAGAIYFGRSYVQRGNKFIGNEIYNLASDSSYGGQYGIYLDDCYCGATIQDNYFHDITGTAVFLNGGRDNTVIGNEFKNISGTGVVLANTGLTDWNGASDDEFFRTMGLKSGLHTTAPYAKYAHLANVLNDEPRKPKYNVVSGNSFTSVGTNVSIALFEAAEGITPITEAEYRQLNTVLDS